MTHLITRFLLVNIFTILLLIPPTIGQKCSGKQKSNNSQTAISQTAIAQNNTRRHVDIQLPPNYQPPVANQKLITFPETVANKKKKKKLLKKRKKNKKKGCAATKM